MLIVCFESCLNGIMQSKNFVFQECDNNNNNNNNNKNIHDAEDRDGYIEQFNENEFEINETVKGQGNFN